MRTLEKNCHNCGEKIIVAAKEVRYRLKKNPNHNFYCSLSCAGEKNLGNLDGKGGNIGVLQRYWEERRRLPKDKLEEIETKRRMGEFVRRAKGRKSKGETDLDKEYLYDLWLSQGGICALSGVELHLPNNSKLSDHDPHLASLDRIDCTKGYLKGNVRFLSMIANLARNCWDDETVVQFARSVVSRNS